MGEDARALEARRRLARGGVTALAVVLAVVLVVAGFLQVRSFVQGLGDRATGGHTIDRTGPVLLQSMRDLSRYEAAAGTFQVIVDLEKDAGFLPAAVVGERTLFVAIGTVNAFVDFSSLGDDAITVSPDGRSAQVRLPHAALERPNLDHQRSYVFSQERGLVDRVRAVLDQSPNEQAELYQVAERRIGEEAAKSPLAARAEANTRTMLLDLLRTLGYQQATITFA